MANNHSGRSDEELTERLAIGRAAYAAEMRRSLRDPKAWVEQALCLICAIVKGICLVWVIELQLHDICDAPEQALLIFRPILVSFAALLVAANPFAMFWRIVFADRANEAFSRALDEQDERNWY